MTTTLVGVHLGTHVRCRGQVVLVSRAQSGYRFCTDCGARGGDVQLVEEQPETESTVKCTLSRRVRAFQYVSKLKLGYVIGPEEELATEAFGIYMQQALSHYGLDIEQAIGGWKVVLRVHVE